MKKETENEYRQLVNQVIDYISSHLNEKIQLDSLASRMCVSPYHFHRIMRTYLNEPLANYITRQRLERSAMLLKTKSISLTELAEKVGYETPQSFSKAFKIHFGISPAAFRKVSYSDFSVIRKENKFIKPYLKPVVTQEKDINTIYIRIIGKYGDKKQYTHTWKKLGEFLNNKNLRTPETRWFGISFDDPDITLHTQCRFYACAGIQIPFSPEGEFGSLKIKAGNFAVYTYTGNDDSLQNIYDNIYYNFPYELRDASSYEEYLYDGITGKLITRIYIPIN